MLSPVTSEGSRVGGELDAAEGAADAARERLGQHRLAQPGHVVQQHVALAQDRGEDVLDDPLAADDHAADAGAHAAGGLGDIRERRGRCVRGRCV